MLELKLTAQAYDAKMLVDLLKSVIDAISDADDGEPGGWDFEEEVQDGDTPEEKADFTVIGEELVNSSGATVTADDFNCERCGEHVARGDTFYEDQGAYCMDCGMDIQDGDDDEDDGFNDDSGVGDAGFGADAEEDADA